MQIKILDKELYTNADLLPKTAGSAGIDLKLARDARSCYELYAGGKPYQRHDLVGTGLAVAIPLNFVGLIIPRSSTGHKHGFHLGNTVGVIDSDYRGELMLSIGGGEYNKLKRGDAVAQLIVVPAYYLGNRRIVEEFEDITGRGDGGFGSTDSFSDQDIELRYAALPSQPGAETYLIADHCPGKGCADSGCPSHGEQLELDLGHSTEPLPDTTRGYLSDIADGMGAEQRDEYHRNKSNGGF